LSLLHLKVLALLENAKGALSDIGALRDSGYFIPGMEQIEQDIKSAMAEERLAWLRRALSGYIIRKCRDLLKSEK
jgi:hypothetical protein